MKINYDIIYQMNYLDFGSQYPSSKTIIKSIPVVSELNGGVLPVEYTITIGYKNVLTSSNLWVSIETDANGKCGYIVYNPEYLISTVCIPEYVKYHDYLCPVVGFKSIRCCYQIVGICHYVNIGPFYNISGISGVVSQMKSTVFNGNIPDGFASLSSLVYLDIPNVKNVGEFAFAHCKELIAVRIMTSESVLVNRYAFYNTPVLNKFIYTAPDKIEYATINLLDNSFKSSYLSAFVASRGTVSPIAFSKPTLLINLASDVSYAKSCINTFWYDQFKWHIFNITHTTFLYDKTIEFGMYKNNLSLRSLIFDEKAEHEISNDIIGVVVETKIKNTVVTIDPLIITECIESNWLGTTIKCNIIEPDDDTYYRLSFTKVVDGVDTTVVIVLNEDMKNNSTEHQFKNDSNVYYHYFQDIFMVYFIDIDAGDVVDYKYIFAVADDNIPNITQDFKIAKVSVSDF